MRKLLFIAAIITCCSTHAQTKKDTVLWGFSITNYMLSLNDTTTVVQIKLPEGLHLIKANQFGLLHGIQRGENVDTVEKGVGKCYLIKGNYYYFAIKQFNGRSPRQSDLVYAFVRYENAAAQPAIFFCASHNITFTNVTDSAFYRPLDFLQKRTAAQNDRLVQRMAADIQFTGNYFLQHDTSMNKPITSGMFAGKSVLDVMATATAQNVTDFVRYVAARPLRYAGNTWKISETFATWLLNGAPVVIEN